MSSSIYICAHKDFKEAVTNKKVYKIVTGENCKFENHYSVPFVIERNEEDSLLALNPSLGECSRIYWIWKHESLSDYIGICHYRRYFYFLNDVPDFDLEFKIYDAILPTPLKENIYVQYKGCHNLNDLLKINEILKDLYGVQDFKETNCIFPGNMFIMKKNDFCNYCQFVFSVIFEFMRRNNLHIMEDVDKYVEENRFQYSWYIFEYQRRILGFLMERISSFYFLKRFSNPKISKVQKL